MREIELLSPAKSYDAARAAVDHGADALYMGGVRFGARVGACNSLEDMARAVEYAHQYGVRLYATMNTLIFEEELAEAEAVARDIVAAGVDALIVQDMAFARMGLGVELHASTQMCNATAEGVRFLSDLGFRRVVMERNLSLERLSQIREAVPEVDMEVFVHGAICVGYSGACLLSRSMSPLRSGNRGGCSQPCRVSYDLVDGAGRRLMEGRHLLSVKDLNLSGRIGELLDIGVSSFKIEGRLKDLSYTKNIVSHYRRSLDEAMAERGGFKRSSQGRSKIEFTPNPAKSFSRGETIYMLDGQQRGVASFDTPKSMGEFVGRVKAIRGEQIEVSLQRGVTFATGDGVCYVSGGRLEGSNINRIDGGDRSEGLCRITLSRKGDLKIGVELYRNFDRSFEAAVDSSRTRRVISTVGALRSCCSIQNSSTIEVEYRDESGCVASASMEGTFEQAKSRDKMEQTIRVQLSKCGETIFEATEIDLSGWGGEFIAVSQLAALRREALERLRLNREEFLKELNEVRKEIFRENREAIYPATEAATTNSLAEKLYREHGAQRLVLSDELRTDYTGVEVLKSNYCIRNEMGECLRRGSKLKEELYLERGEHRFHLKFDCQRCEMRLIKVLYDDK